MKQVLLLVSHHEICFPGWFDRDNIGKAGRIHRPAFIGMLACWIKS